MVNQEIGINLEQILFVSNSGRRRGRIVGVCPDFFIIIEFSFSNKKNTIFHIWLVLSLLWQWKDTLRSYYYKIFEVDDQPTYIITKFLISPCINYICYKLGTYDFYAPAWG